MGLVMVAQKLGLVSPLESEPLVPSLGLVSALAPSQAQIRQLGEEKLAQMWHLVYSLGLVSPLEQQMGLMSPLAPTLGN